GGSAAAAAALLALIVGSFLALSIAAIPWIVFLIARHRTAGKARELANARGPLPLAITFAATVIAACCCGLENWQWFFFAELVFTVSGCLWITFRVSLSDPADISIFDWPPAISWLSIALLTGPTFAAG